MNNCESVTIEDNKMLGCKHLFFYGTKAWNWAVTERKRINFILFNMKDFSVSSIDGMEGRFGGGEPDDINAHQSTKEQYMYIETRWHWSSTERSI